MFDWVLIMPLILSIILLANSSLSLDINDNPGGWRHGRAEISKTISPSLMIYTE